MYKRITLIVCLIGLFISSFTQNVQVYTCFEQALKEAKDYYNKEEYFLSIRQLFNTLGCSEASIVKKYNLSLYNEVDLYLDSCKIKIEQSFKYNEAMLNKTMELLNATTDIGFNSYFDFYYDQYILSLNECTFDIALTNLNLANICPDIPDNINLENEIEKINYLKQLNDSAIIYYSQAKYTNALSCYSKIEESNILKSDNLIIKQKINYCKKPIFKRTEEDAFISIENGNYKHINKETNQIDTIRLSKYKIYRYEISNSEFAEFLNIYGSDKVKSGGFKGEAMIEYGSNGIMKKDNCWIVSKGFEHHPVIRISWYGAYEFCKFWGLSLPTEAQWEYAASNQGEKILYSWGNSKSLKLASTKANFASIINKSSNYSNIHQDIFTKTDSVSAFEHQNKIGLYNMSGNVWEWCIDYYDEDFFNNNNGNLDPIGENGYYKVLKGGSWYDDIEKCEIFYRNCALPGNRYSNTIGFRPIINLE